MDRVKTIRSLVAASPSTRPIKQAHALISDCNNASGSAYRVKRCHVPRTAPIGRSCSLSAFDCGEPRLRYIERLYYVSIHDIPANSLHTQLVGVYHSEYNDVCEHQASHKSTPHRHLRSPPVQRRKRSQDSRADQDKQRALPSSDP